MSEVEVGAGVLRAWTFSHADEVFHRHVSEGVLG